MNNEEIKKLRNKIVEYQNRDVFVLLQNSIQYHITICNAKIIISNEKLIISDEKNQDFIIELQYLEKVIINGNMIDLEMSTCIKITLDY